MSNHHMKESPETFSDSNDSFLDGILTDKVNSPESKKDSDSQRESSPSKSGEGEEARNDAGDLTEDRQIPWIKEGLEELKRMEMGSFSFGQGDDHFFQVLNATAPTARRTAELLDQVLELRSELEGRIKDLSNFKDEIRELGKLFKADSSQHSQDQDQDKDKK